MERCILCGRKISNTRYNFGLGCLKKMCNRVNIYNAKNLKAENLLDRKISRLCNKRTLPKAQRQLLTDRYLTFNLLNEVQVEGYNNYKELLQNDINSINRTTNIEDLKSYNMITLKQASEINKKYKKHENVFQNIMDGKYDAIQNFSFDILRFAFSNYYNDKPYLSDMTQALQYCILKSGVLALRLINYKYSADFLDNSLHRSPKDINITEGDIITKIQEDDSFKDCINRIIKKYDNKEWFDTGENNESVSFEDGDLFFALHSTNIRVIGNKQENGKWNLDVTLSDVYDFTDFKELEEYIDGNNFANAFIGSNANNLAMIGTACKVVNEYNITIEFKIENWEGK